VRFFLFSFSVSYLTRPTVPYLIYAHFFLRRNALEASQSSLQDAARHVAPVRPPPGEKPAKGFTWEDYEGVQVDEDASGEEDGGWGVVRSRRSQFPLLSVLSESIRTEIFPSLIEPNNAVVEGAGGVTGTATTTAASQSQPQTKRQRQNAQKREALKEAKRERDAQQQAALATHKHELVHARAVEQVAPTSKRTGSRFDSLS